MRLKAIRGTRDILPGEVERWLLVEAAARRVFARYGFGEIRTPIFEDSAVFVKGTGEETDIVKKEMYRFVDHGGNDLTLRPEGTPPVIRAYLEHGLDHGRPLDRYFYIGPMFRYERPQKGRYRQFHQIGVEALGARDARVDAEVVEMAMRWLAELGVTAGLAINTVGDEPTRLAYREELVKAQAERLDELCEECQRRHLTNPLRVLDCKVASCQAIIATFPTIHGHLSAESASHFQTLQRTLKSRGVDYEVAPRLVRGLDYYREAVFEITSSALGAQDALVGGGRYDGLIERMGGGDVPATGFASGLERILMAMGEDAVEPAVDLFVIAFDDSAVDAAHEITHGLRCEGLRALTAAYDQRSKKAQSRAARRARAALQLTVGPDEITTDRYTLKRIADGELAESSRAELGVVARRLLGAAPSVD